MNNSNRISNKMPGGAELSEKLPEPIFQLVESFKKFIREQKAYRDQRFDVDAILEVGRETEEFTLAFQRVAFDSDRNAQLVQQIKDDTTKLLRHSELAYSLLRSHFSNNPSIYNLQPHQPNSSATTNATTQIPSTTVASANNVTNANNTTEPLIRFSQVDGTTQQQTTLNTTSSSIFNQSHQPFQLRGNAFTSSHQHNQFSNTAAAQYFAELADQFEARMKAYGEQIKELKMSLDSITRAYNADELFKWLKKQHETLGEIAAKIYMTHERIMEKKSELDKFNNEQSKMFVTTS